MSEAVRVEGARVDAGGKTILGPVDLSVAEGEHVVVVGASGSGKTTLLRAVAGLARLSAGRIALFGEVASEGRRLVQPPAARRIGMLFQNGALWPHMSARRTLEFVLARRGLARSARRGRASELLELVELAGFERRTPGTLSGGERQRLGLARALAGDPRLLLLDEPLGPLDAELRGELLARLDELQRRLGLTMLHVTHDPGESRRYSDRTLRMEEGRWKDAAPAVGGGGGTP